MDEKEVLRQNVLDCEKQLNAARIRIKELNELKTIASEFIRAYDDYENFPGQRSRRKLYDEKQKLIASLKDS